MIKRRLLDYKHLVPVVVNEYVGFIRVSAEESIERINLAINEAIENTVIDDTNNTNLVAGGEGSGSPEEE